MYDNKHFKRRMRVYGTFDHLSDFPLALCGLILWVMLPYIPVSSRPVSDLTITVASANVQIDTITKSIV